MQKFECNDFMFELTDDEVEELCKVQIFRPCKSVDGQAVRYNPHVFTEQGLYMLMTVLKGDHWLLNRVRHLMKNLQKNERLHIRKS